VEKRRQNIKRALVLIENPLHLWPPTGVHNLKKGGIADFKAGKEKKKAPGFSSGGFLGPALPQIPQS